MNRFSITSPLLAAVLMSIAPGSGAPDTQPDPTKPLPRVLLIGDSISGGYQKGVKKLLEGKAVVVKNEGNAQYTGTGLKKLDGWLGDGNWDVIHFNWGLWDMYGWEYAKEDRSPAVYERNLETLVTRLGKTGAKLIWATTTPACPDPEGTMLKRFKTELRITPEVERQYLDAALRVMKKHNVQVNDLHALMLPDLDKYLPAPDNVHFTGEGGAVLARQVADSILATLAASGTSARPENETSATTKSVKILQLSDMHITDRKSLDYPRKVIAAMNKEGGDLVIAAGDLATDGKRSELELARELLGELDMPSHVVQGNHDVLHPAGGEEKLFREVFATKTNSCHFTTKGIHFMVIAHGCGRSYRDNSVRPEVLAWMRETLDAMKDDKPFILVSHYPFAKGVRYETPNAAAVLSLFEGRNLLAVMSGHFHGNTENIQNGVLMTTTACCSGTRGNHDGTKAKGYRVFHIDGQMKITTEFREVQP